MGLLGLLMNSNKTVLNIDGKFVPVHNKKEAEFYANQFLKHCYESADIVNHTKNPDVFFSRYDFLISETKNLVQLEKMISFTGTKPSRKLRELINMKEDQTNLMIQRAFDNLDIKINKLKTVKGKENAINKLYNEFLKFEGSMTARNKELVKIHYDTFINKFD